MEACLRERLPEATWQHRLRREAGRASIEFGPGDIDRLARLGIEADRLGPRLVACLWDEESPLEVGGYLVVDNLSMGRPSMGGIRMRPDLTPAAVFNLARGMTLKNAAADLPHGGGASRHDAARPTGAVENGLDSAVSKPVEMGGNQIDQLGAAAGGVVIALEQILLELPRLHALPQFVGLPPPAPPCPPPTK